MKKVQQGFTLIELMIVVAIVGILAAIALPAYQDYITRSKVSELVIQADGCKTAVAEYYSTTGTLPTDTAASGCTSQQSQYVSGLAVAAGVITVSGTSAVPAGIDIVLTPAATSTDQPLTWTCSTSTAANGKYVPSNCR